MKLIYKETKEEINVTFAAYHFNPAKKVKEDGIVIIIPGKKAYHYATLEDMFKEWGDIPTKEEK